MHAAGRQSAPPPYLTNPFVFLALRRRAAYMAVGSQDERPGLAWHAGPRSTSVAANQPKSA